MSAEVSTEVVVAELASIPELRMGHCGSLLLMVWRGRTTIESIGHANAVEEKFLERFPRITVLGVIADGATGNPNAPLIRAAADAAKKFHSAVLGTAIVLLTDGAPARAARMVLDGLVSFVGESERYRLFSSVQPAMEWIWRLPRQEAALLRQDTVEAVKRFVQESTTMRVPPSPAHR